MTSAPVLATRLDLPLVRRGKVRDVYTDGPDRLLIVATDRISAFDCVLGSGIPDKGRILTQMSAFWFDRLREVIPNHLLSMDPADFPAEVRVHASELEGRAMLVRRTDPLPVECVARGYLAGSGWKDYQRTGTICGHGLPPGLLEGSRLPAPLFTPATKAESGHDENISEARAAAIVGAGISATLREATLALYQRGAAHAEGAGIIVADTKFEFGVLDAPGSSTDTAHRRSDPTGRLLLIDEALTPDSSRFWPSDAWRPGGPQPSFDKQFVRDYLETIRWTKQPPAPVLPDDVVARTRDKYLEAYSRLTGQAWR